MGWKHSSIVKVGFRWQNNMNQQESGEVDGEISIAENYG
jgi:hypothetical protein